MVSEARVSRLERGKIDIQEGEGVKIKANKTFGEIVARERKALGMTQKELACALNYTGKYVSHNIYMVESGRRGMSADKVEKLRRIFNCDDNYLLGKAGIKNEAEGRNDRTNDWVRPSKAYPEIFKQVITCRKSKEGNIYIYSIGMLIARNAWILDNGNIVPINDVEWWAPISEPPY